MVFVLDDARLSDLTVSVAGMDLTLNLTQFDNGKVQVAGKGAVTIPLTADAAYDKHVRVHLLADGRYIVDEQILDGCHFVSDIDESVALLILTVIPAAATTLGEVK